MTERQRFRSLIEAEGLRLSEEEEEALFTAWERYSSLVEKLGNQVAELDQAS